MNPGFEESPESRRMAAAPGAFPPSLPWLAPSTSRMNLPPALHARWDSGGILSRRIPAFHKSQAELLKNPAGLQQYSGSILSSLIIEADPPESETAMMPTTKTAKRPKVALSKFAKNIVYKVQSHLILGSTNSILPRVAPSLA
jgi:hypothetical protein